MNVLDSFRLDGRRAVVTGGSRGLGLEMARALGQAGAELVLVGRDEEHLKQAREVLTSEGLRVSTVAADLGVPDEAERLCERLLREFDPIDILVNNVGGRRINIPTEDLPLADWQKIIDLNLTHAFLCTKLLGGAMLKRRRGRIINVSSISGMWAGRAMRGRAYETSKAALTMFTKAVAADWAQYGVTVNAIAPGPFLTEANRRWIGERPEFKSEVEALIPMARWGEPHEIGGLAVYLASDASSFMTGSVVVIDGGKLLW
ncbi:MAG: SDR family oxidoreductase [Planctomycetia bacterium]|nr:SDR family oxidoreductase [Planctomycetia bacterium]